MDSSDIDLREPPGAENNSFDTTFAIGISQLDTTSPPHPDIPKELRVDVNRPIQIYMEDSTARKQILGADDNSIIENNGCPHTTVDLAGAHKLPDTNNTGSITQETRVQSSDFDEPRVMHLAGVSSDVNMGHAGLSTKELDSSGFEVDMQKENDVLVEIESAQTEEVISYPDANLISPNDANIVSLTDVTSVSCTDATTASYTDINIVSYAQTSAVSYADGATMAYVDKANEVINQFTPRETGSSNISNVEMQQLVSLGDLHNLQAKSDHDFDPSHPELASQADRSSISQERITIKTETGPVRSVLSFVNSTGMNAGKSSPPLSGENLNIQGLIPYAEINNSRIRYVNDSSVQTDAMSLCHNKPETREASVSCDINKADITSGDTGMLVHKIRESCDNNGSISVGNRGNDNDSNNKTENRQVIDSIKLVEDNEQSVLDYKQHTDKNNECIADSFNTPDIDKHETNFLKNVLLLWKDNLFIDVVIKNQNQSISAHKVVLAANSKLFHSLLKSQSSSTCEIDLTEYNIPSDIIHILVQSMYTGHLDTINSIRENVLTAAEVLQMELILRLALSEDKELDSTDENVNSLVPEDESCNTKTNTEVNGDVGEKSSLSRRGRKRSLKDTNRTKDKKSKHVPLKKRKFEETYECDLLIAPTTGSTKKVSRVNVPLTRRRSKLLDEKSTKEKKSKPPKITKKTKRSKQKNKKSPASLDLPKKKEITEEDTQSTCSATTNDFASEGGSPKKKRATAVDDIALQLASEKSDMNTSFEADSVVSNDDDDGDSKPNEKIQNVSFIAEKPGYNNAVQFGESPNSSDSEEADSKYKIKEERAEEKDSKTKRVSYSSNFIKLPNGRLKCSKCEYRPKDNKTMASHWRRHIGEKPYVCHFCGKSFIQNKHLKNHIRIHTGERPYKCEQCESTFITSSHLKRHMLTHTGEKPFQCTYDGCNAKYAEKYSLKVHVESTHENLKRYKCEYEGCTYRGTSKQCLDLHQQKHLPEDQKSKRICDVCGKLLVGHQALKIHAIMHKGETITCPHCDYQTKFKSSMTSHVVRLHGVDLEGNKVTPKFNCHVCGFQAHFLTEFNFHLQKHRGLKPHKCPVCDFATEDKGSLKKHIRTHTGETPFNCHLCKKGYTQQSGLARHMRSHYGVKPHQCPQCDKSYADKKSLVAHLYKHNNIKPFECTSCGYTCTKKETLDVHMKRIHGLSAFDGHTKVIRKKYYADGEVVPEKNPQYLKYARINPLRKPTVEMTDSEDETTSDNLYINEDLAQSERNMAGQVKSDHLLSSIQLSGAGDAAMSADKNAGAFAFMQPPSGQVPFIIAPMGDMGGLDPNVVWTTDAAGDVVPQFRVQQMQ